MAYTKTTYPTPIGCCGPSYFARISTKEPTTLTWDQVYRLISEDLQIEQTTDLARKYRDQGDTKAYSATKAKSGAITPAAQCQCGHNTANVMALTGISMVDLDHVPIYQLYDTIKAVKADCHTFLCHVTCSGEGIHILFHYTSKQPEIAYSDAWEWGNQYYSIITGLEADKAVHETKQLPILDAPAAVKISEAPFRVFTRYNLIKFSGATR